MSIVRVAPLHAALGEGSEEEVRSLMRDIVELADIEAGWDDEGAEVLSQDWDIFDLHGVRSLAAHLDYPPRALGMRRGFKLLDDPRDSKSLKKIFEGAETTFPHLMRHSDNKGLWIPLLLPEPVCVDEEKWWMIGSVPGALAELERVLPHLDDGGPVLRAHIPQ